MEITAQSVPHAAWQKKPHARHIQHQPALQRALPKALNDCSPARLPWQAAPAIASYRCR